MTGEKGRLFGVMVTFKRPGELAKSLDKLLAQTRRLDLLLVIDNGSTPESEAEVERYRSEGAEAVYIDAGENIGPAEGYARGSSVSHGVRPPTTTG